MGESTFPEHLLLEYPTPWRVESVGDLDWMIRIIAANESIVWDVCDANDNAELAKAVMNLVNQSTQQPESKSDGQ